MSSVCGFATVPFSACLKQDGSKNMSEVAICNGVSCTANGGGMRSFVALQALAAYNTDVTISMTGCLGACKEGANVVINGKSIVNANQVLGKLSIRPDVRALRGIKLKVYADKLKSSRSDDDNKRRTRAYRIALRCLSDNPKGDGVCARIAANLANAYIDGEMFGEALETAKWGMELEETQGALYAALVSSFIISESSAMEDMEYWKRLDKENKTAAAKWMKERERRSAWRKLGSIFFQKS